MNKLLIVTQQKPAASHSQSLSQQPGYVKKHMGYDRASGAVGGGVPSRAKAMSAWAEVINEGLYYYEQELQSELSDQPVHPLHYVSVSVHAQTVPLFEIFRAILSMLDEFSMQPFVNSKTETVGLSQSAVDFPLMDLSVSFDSNQNAPLVPNMAEMGAYTYHPFPPSCFAFHSLMVCHKLQCVEIETFFVRFNPPLAVSYSDLA